MDKQEIRKEQVNLVMGFTIVLFIGWVCYQALWIFTL